MLPENVANAVFVLCSADLGHTTGPSHPSRRRSSFRVPAMTSAVAAVNLGATSGRVMLGFVSHNVLALRPVARFPNSPVIKPDGLHWDVSALYEHFRAGLAAAIREEPDLASIGVDSWAVDYGLLRGGELIAEPFHYRDGRRARGVA